MAIPLVPPPRPWLAALFSLLLPGLGHVYGGDFRLGALAYGGSAALVLLGVGFTFRTRTGFILSAAAWGLWVLAMAAHAGLRARRRPWRPKGWHTRLAVLVPAALLAALLLTGGVPRALLPRARYLIMEGDSNSMMPTVAHGDVAVGDTGYYRHRPIQRGDLILFDPPEGELRFWLKRCVAVAGDQVEIRDGAFYLNGALQPQGSRKRFLAPAQDAANHCAPFRVPPGTVFCLGDNWDDSYDSRHWGPLAVAAVRGKLLYSLRFRPEPDSIQRGPAQLANERVKA